MPTIKKLLFVFALAVIVVRPSIAADSLAVSPTNPTIMDSIRLSILIKNSSCCAQYVHDSTAVTLSNDSTILLSFVSSLPICNCILAPINDSTPYTVILSYKRRPLPAGHYSVYEVESQGCIAGQACPQASLVVMQTFIGKFTVSGPTATVFHQKSIPLENIGKISGNGRVYNVRGALVSPNQISDSRHTPGVYFIKPDERSTATLKIWY